MVPKNKGGLCSLVCFMKKVLSGLGWKPVPVPFECQACGVAAIFLIAMAPENTVIPISVRHIDMMMSVPC